MNTLSASVTVLAYLDYFFSMLSRHLATASVFSLSFIIMDLWAMSALRSLRRIDGRATPGPRQSFDVMLALFIHLLKAFAVAFVFVVGRATLVGLGRSADLGSADLIASIVAVAVAGVLWLALPRLQLWLDDQARLVVEGRVPEGKVKGALRRFLRFDPANPGLLSGLFYVRLILVDAVLVMYVIAKSATMVLALVGVGGI